MAGSFWDTITTAMVIMGDQSRLASLFRVIASLHLWDAGILLTAGVNKERPCIHTSLVERITHFDGAPSRRHSNKLYVAQGNNGALTR
jgi:hypothetical protein